MVMVAFHARHLRVHLSLWRVMEYSISLIFTALSSIASISLICLMISDWYFLMSDFEKLLAKEILLHNSYSLSQLWVEGIRIVLFGLSGEIAFFVDDVEDASVMMYTGRSNAEIAAPFSSDEKYVVSCWYPATGTSRKYIAMITATSHAIRQNHFLWKRDAAIIQKVCRNNMFQWSIYT